MKEKQYNLLENITFPQDLKQYQTEELPSVCKELRQFIIDIVSTNPGHFGASLGVVELTVALHYIFNAPYDKIIWDVGHQAYGHKILTGRRSKFHTNRKLGGVSGFPNPAESEYDAFGVGHSSTSISAALGIALASGHQGDKERNVVAVIGDGAMGGGMAIEGLNNAGMQKSNLLVILNDNHMAIDPNVGALNEYLLDITTSKTYNRVKEDIWNILGKLSRFGPNTQGFIQKIENGIKSVILRQSNLFEALNFRYFGPVDGHDVVYLTKVLKDLKDIPGPKLLHCLTKKGKGFKQAELDQTGWHAPGPFNKLTGEKIIIPSSKPLPPKFQDVFGKTVLDLARKNKNIVAITPAMPSGSSLNEMMKEMPERVYDVGIAEQHAVTFSAGLAIQGLLPFCTIYSSFMQRAYDQIIHDVALQRLNVVFCLDRGGLVGEDGPTHHGVFDLAYMRIIPNMIVAAPMDEVEFRNMLYTAQLRPHGPFSVRYPKGRGNITDWKKPYKEIIIGKGRMITKGEKVAILSLGKAGILVTNAIDVLHDEGYYPAHYDMRFLKPLDSEMLHKIFQEYDHIITVEDGTIKGGFGSAVLEFMSDNGYALPVKRLGVPDTFIEHGSTEELYQLCGFDTYSIVQTVKNIISAKTVRMKVKQTHKVSI